MISTYRSFLINTDGKGLIGSYTNFLIGTEALCIVRAHRWAVCPINALIAVTHYGERGIALNSAFLVAFTAAVRLPVTLKLSLPPVEWLVSPATVVEALPSTFCGGIADGITAGILAYFHVVIFCALMRNSSASFYRQ